MMEKGGREQAVRAAFEALSSALEGFAQAYAAWAADPGSLDAGARLADAEAKVVVAREALEALERALGEHR